MRVCGNCNTKNRESARYCDQCGTRFEGAPAPAAATSYTPKHLADQILRSRAALAGERKHVTVLFADIKGSTTLAESAGAEAWHELLNQFFAILSAAVHRYEGTVNQYTGDGIMALFGAPIAHEDHAPRAAMAALEMQREVRAFAARLQQERALALHMRVGLNTGEVVVGRIGDDLRMDYTAKGLTVNLAARMEQICEAGAINVSRYTEEAIRDHFRLLDLGERTVAGVSHPVRVFQLQAAQADTPARELARAAGPLAGRAAELALLKRALAQVREGAGRIVAISGEAGIGKSRLCHEFVRHCWQETVPVHHAAGVAYAAAMPLLPVQALLRSRLGLIEGAAPDEVRTRVAAAFPPGSRRKSLVVPAITDFLGAGGGQERGAAVRSLMLERIARFLPRSDTPQVLLVEDLHCADPATEDFLTRLCEQIAGSHTLLLLNYRSDYNIRWLAPYLDQRVELHALEAAEVEALAAQQLGPAPAMLEVARGIAERAGGNPFFVQEAVAALAEAGHLAGVPGAYALARPIDEWPIPPSVQALVAGRVDRLPEEQKSLLQLAAVMGRVFEPWVLAVCSQGEHQHDLAALTAAGFVRARPRGDYEFCHALTQEITYHSQLEAQRAITHAAVAGALEAHHAGGAPADIALQIAHHWQQAEAWDKAGAWSLKAAAYFAARDAHATLAQYRRAIDSLERAEYSFETLRLRVAARAGLIRTAQLLPLEPAEIETAYHDGWKMAAEFSDIESGAELLFSYAGELLRRGDHEAAAQMAAQAAEDAHGAGSHALIRRFRPALLMAHNLAGRLEEGLALALRGGDDWIGAPVSEDNYLARACYGALRMWRGALAPAQEHLEACVAYAEREGREVIWAQADLVDLAWFSGDHTRALEHAEAALVRARTYGSPLLNALALRAHGLALLLLGDAPRALSVLESGLPLVAPGAFGAPLRPHYLPVLAEAYAAMQRSGEARTAATAAIDEARAGHARVWELRAWAAYRGVGGPRLHEAGPRVEELVRYTGAQAFAMARRPVQK